MTTTPKLPPWKRLLDLIRERAIANHPAPTGTLRELQARLRAAKRTLRRLERGHA